MVGPPPGKRRARYPSYFRQGTQAVTTSTTSCCCQNGWPQVHVTSAECTALGTCSVCVPCMLCLPTHLVYMMQMKSSGLGGEGTGACALPSSMKSSKE